MSQTDTLMYWLSHMGSGSWTTFKRVAAQLFPDAEDVAIDSATVLRLMLSELGHVEFFVDRSRNWQVTRPTLIGLSGQPGKAALCGARSPQLLDELENAAARMDCRFHYQESETHPAQVIIEGSDEALSATVSAVKVAPVTYEPDLARRMCTGLVGISSVIENAPEDRPPNWESRYFDINTRKWVSGSHDGAAHEYRSSYFEYRYFLRREGKYLVMGKREAVYASAILDDVKLVSYVPSKHMLHTPINAPLPVRYAQVACLCSVQPSRVQNYEHIYDHIPPDIASILLILSGRPYYGSCPL